MRHLENESVPHKESQKIPALQVLAPANRFSRLANLPDGHLAPRHRLLGRFLVSSVLRRLAPIHQPSPSSTSTPEVRVLPSTGITRLHRSYDPVRLPRRPTPDSAVEAATLV